jgi:primary-amine oxidase
MPYKADERYPTGDYPNQILADTRLDARTRADRELTATDVHEGRSRLTATDVVVWYNFRQTHIPRLEDLPVMPVTSVDYLLKPDGFFNANPAMDVTPPSR